MIAVNQGAGQTQATDLKPSKETRAGCILEKAQAHTWAMKKWDFFMDEPQLRYNF